MRKRTLPLVLAVALLLAACGGDDDDDGATTTTTSEATDETGSTIAPKPQATLEDIARVVVQMDENLRSSMTNGRPCLDGDAARCTGLVLEHYDGIGVTGKQIVDVLPLLIKQGSNLYQGEPNGEIVSRIDTTVNLGAQLRSAFDAARATCVPDFPPECADATTALKSAMDEVLKDFNLWRDEYNPATDPATQGDGDGVVVEPES